jgi:molybdenum ABC transporter molybdate-binding protein
MKFALTAALIALCVISPGAVRAQAPVHIAVWSSPSLRRPLSEAARAFTERTGTIVDLSFGAGGKLRERLENGEPADVFISGDVDDARRLHDGGKFGPVTIPTSTAMCLLVKSSLAGTRPVADLMLDPAVRVVTGIVSPPHSDPSGDYAEQIFAKIDKLRPGSLALLDAKALRYPSPALSVPAGADVQIYLLVTSNQADASVLYCASLDALTAADPTQLRALSMPPELAVQADFGLTVRVGAPPQADAFRTFLASDAGQAIFVKYGFTRV